MTEVRDRKNFWKSSGVSPPKRRPLSPRFENILLLVSDGKINFKSINKELCLKQSTLYYQLDSLIKRGYLYAINKGKPRHLDLTIAGFDYIKKCFPKKLSGGLSGAELGNVGSPVRVVQKAHTRDSFSFDISNFRQTVKLYFQKIEQGLDTDVPYPFNPLLLTRAHTIQYSFPITQQSKFLTYQCKTHGIGALARKVWVTSWGDKVGFHTKPMGRAKGRPTWIKYYGTLCYHNTRYFIMFSAEKVHVRFTVNFHTHPIDSAFEILDKLFWIKKELEDLLSINESPFQLGSPNHYYIATQIMAHYGLELEPLSIIADQMGVSLIDKGGRLLIDASNGIPELEGVHSGFSLDDIVWLFEEMIWKIRNRYSLQQAKQEITALQEGIAAVEEDLVTVNTHLVRSGNQALVLSDQVSLVKQHNHVIESSMEQVSYHMALLAKETYYSTAQTNARLDSLENMEEGKKSNYLTKIHPIVALITQNPGITRRDLDQTLDKYHGYANRIVYYYKQKNLIREEKVGRRAGRLFIKKQDVK